MRYWEVFKEYPVRFVPYFIIFGALYLIEKPERNIKGEMNVLQN